jgi:hypothetical protein
MFGPANLLLLPFGAVLVGVALFRARKYRTPIFRIALLELLAVLIAVAAWFLVRTMNYLAGPPDGDIYAQTWGFQAIVFVLVYLPWALTGAGTFLLGQSLFLSPAGSNAP